MEGVVAQKGAASDNDSEEAPAVVKERAASVKRPARPPPISILKSAAASSGAAKGASQATPHLCIQGYTDVGSSTASTPTLGKRPRSPNDLYSQIMNTDQSKDVQNEATSRSKKQRMGKSQVHWKSDGELRMIKIVERYSWKDQEGEEGHEMLSHKGEGKLLKGPRLEYYDPLPVLVPEAFLQRRILSIDVGKRLVLEDEEGEEGSRISIERSPTESFSQSLSVDVSDLRRETAIVHLPEWLFQDVELVQYDWQQEQHYQADEQPALNDGHAFLKHADSRIDKAGVSRGVSTGQGVENSAYSKGHPDRYTVSTKRRRGSREEAGITRDEDRVDEDMKRDAMMMDLYGRESRNGRRSSTDHQTMTVQGHEQSNIQYERHTLPIPKGQTVHERAASDPIKASNAKDSGAQVPHRSASNNEKRKRGSKEKHRKNGIQEICHFHMTPGGCTRRNNCRYQHP